MSLSKSPQLYRQTLDLDSPLLPTEDLLALAETVAEELAETQSPTLKKWFDVAGSPLPRIFKDPSSAQVGHPHLQALHAHWMALPRAGDLPATSRLDAAEMSEWLGDLLLLEVLDGGRDFRYRVYGTFLADHVGFDLTGKLTSKMPETLGIGSMIPLFFLAVYRRAVLDRCPWYSEHQPPQTITAFFWRRLILPFADEDGRVTRLLIGILPSSRDIQPRPHITLGRRKV